MSKIEVDMAEDEFDEMLKDIIALCDQDENDTIVSRDLKHKCQKRLAYHYLEFHISKKEKVFLKSLYDPDMDEEVKHTIETITK